MESGINALENHGLDRCPDKGSKAFHCYISFAVLARNIQVLGNFLQEKEIARKMLAKGLDLDTISEMTNLPLEEIEKLNK